MKIFFFRHSFVNFFLIVGDGCSMGIAGGSPNPYGGGGNSYGGSQISFAPPSGGNPYGGSSMGGNPYGGAPPSGGNPYSGSSMGGNPYGGAPPMGGNPYGGSTTGSYAPPSGGNPYSGSSMGGSPGGNPYGGSSIGSNPYGGAPPSGGNPYGGSTVGGNPYGGSDPARSQSQIASHCVGSGGKRKALIIGINYLRCQRGQLRGCINDANNIARFMGEHFGFSEIRLMTDDTPPNSPNHPIKQNMIQGMNWLVSGAKPGDSFFFHFSGHGGQSEDKSKFPFLFNFFKFIYLLFLFSGVFSLEDDGLNETICPADYQQSGMIVDDDLHDILVRGLPEGCKFTAIFDSCHSGTALDLPYIFKPAAGQFKNAHKAEEDRFWGRHKAQMKDEKKKSGITGFLSTHVGGEISHQVKKKVRQTLNEKKNTTKAIVVMFSGCRDDQTSADTTMANQATGAMSFSFMQTLRANSNAISYEGLLEGMRNVLHNGSKTFTQLPQMSYGRPMDMTENFTM